MSISILKQQRRELVRLTIFLVLSAVIAVWLGAVMGETRPGDRTAYHATFDDVSGLMPGDQVRVAGVTVGKVDAVRVRDDASVQVTFHVRDQITLDTATQAAIKYRNLIGDRILELSKPEKPAGALAAGGTIPVANTSAALDLDTLLNGFKPLFAGLNASQVNELSGQLVRVLQGQGRAVEDLVGTIASVTSTIGEREELVGHVIGNLNQVLGTVDERRGTVGEIIDELSALVVGLEKQDGQILDAAARINEMSGRTGDLLRDARADLHTDLTQLGVAARGLNENADTLEQILQKLSGHYRMMQNSASYGDFFNFFLCGVRIQLSGRDGAPVQGPWIRSDLERCQR